MAHETPRIKAAQRDRLGTRYAARLRSSGKLPAVVYGHQEDPAHVAVDREELLHHLHEGSHMLELELDDGKTETCLVKDVQYDYLGTDIIHVDLTRTSLTEEVYVTVSIELKGREEAPGLKEDGAILEQPLVELEVRCRANAIPDEIVVDISKLEANEA
ncbi:MAG: 50S ribosomal protein L25, partial [Phycisphaeraceae bacterium]